MLLAKCINSGLPCFRVGFFIKLLINIIHLLVINADFIKNPFDLFFFPFLLLPPTTNSFFPSLFQDQRNNLFLQIASYLLAITTWKQEIELIKLAMLDEHCLPTTSS